MAFFPRSEPEPLSLHKFLYYVKHPFTWPGGYELIFYINTGGRLDTYCWQCLDADVEGLWEYYHAMMFPCDSEYETRTRAYVESSCGYDPDMAYCEDCGRDLSPYGDGS